MKYVIAIATITTLLLLASVSSAEPYSQGFRMGVIQKISVKGMMTKSLEGQLNMGREGAPYYTKDSEGNKTWINPWYFSGNPSQQSYVNENVGEYVWAEYHQSKMPTIKYSTSYLIKTIDKVTRQEPNSCSSETAEGTKSEGFRMGRIVKASYKGMMVKSYEIIVQEGNSGGKYKHMSMSDPRMYDCAVAWLKSGKSARISYKQGYFSGLSASTSYDVLKIESTVVDDI